MSRKVSVPSTRCHLGPLAPTPTPWHRRPNSFPYDVSQIVEVLGLERNLRYSSNSPVSLSKTGRAQRRRNSVGNRHATALLGTTMLTRLAVCKRVRLATGSET